MTNLVKIKSLEKFQVVVFNRDKKYLGIIETLYLP